MKYRMLAINPGSTSTKIAVFEDENKVFVKNIDHDAGELARFSSFPEQLPYRRDMILQAIEEYGLKLTDFHVFVGRCGGCDPCAGGTYRVEGQLLEHTRTVRFTNHPAALGAVIANEFAEAVNAQAFVVNPPDVDELEPVARISGLKNAPRASRFHALNQKEIGHRAAVRIGKSYEECNFVIAHVGGGISVGAHSKGRVIDVNDIINGDGPMTPTRCGGVAAGAIIDMCFSGKYTHKQMRELISKNGGVINHLGTSDMREVERMIEDGNEDAALVFEGMIYQVIKAIGANAAVLCGAVDAVVITGGIAHSARAVKQITAAVSFIAQVMIFPGEFEMEALANGALRVLNGVEELQTYGKQS